MNEITKTVEKSLAAIDKGFDCGQPTELPLTSTIANIRILRESQQFEFPDETKVDSLQANILFYHAMNSYFSGAYDPDRMAECVSIDGKHPTGGTDPREGPCAECPCNKWGSAEVGRGKLCTNYLNLFLLPEGEDAPYILKCPPTSLAKRGPLMTFLTYAPSVVRKATGSKAFQLIVAEFTLGKEVFPSGVSSIVVPRTATILDPEEDADRIDELMLWYQRIKNEWQAARAQSQETREAIEVANAAIKAESEVEEVSADDNDDTEYTGAGVPNPDYVGDDPDAVPANDPIRF